MNTSRADRAWIVDSDPSLPWPIALSMSMTSAPRTSPTITRSGFCRRVRRTRRGHADRALALGVGDPLLHLHAVGVPVDVLAQPQLERPLDGDDPLLGTDLGSHRPQQGGLPGSVAPAIMTLNRAWTIARRKSAASSVRVSLPTRSARSTFSKRCRRIETDGRGGDAHHRRQPRPVGQLQVQLRVRRVPGPRVQAGVGGQALDQLDELLVAGGDGLAPLVVALSARVIHTSSQPLMSMFSIDSSLSSACSRPAPYMRACTPSASSCSVSGSSGGCPAPSSCSACSRIDVGDQLAGVLLLAQPGQRRPAVGAAVCCSRCSRSPTSRCTLRSRSGSTLMP